MTNVLPPALILAAGLGTRLRPLTYSRAKAAVPVAGIPLIRRQVTKLTATGIREVVVNLHHRPETIAAVLGDGHTQGCRIRYSWEREVLGSAGGPRHALPLLDTQFFLVNGDTLTNVDLNGLWNTHASRGARVTLAVTGHPAPDRYGGIVANTDGWVTGVARAGEQRNALHFVGVQVANSDVFASLPDGVSAASIGGVYDELLTNGHHIAVHHVSGDFHDIGTPADYLTTNHKIAATEGLASQPFGCGTDVHPGAKIHGSILWNDVSVETGCVLTECIVTDSVQIPAGTHLSRQVVVLAPSGSVMSKINIPGSQRLGDLLIVPIEATIHRPQ